MRVCSSPGPVGVPYSGVPPPSPPAPPVALAQPMRRSATPSLRQTPWALPPPPPPTLAGPPLRAGAEGGAPLQWVALFAPQTSCRTHRHYFLVSLVLCSPPAPALPPRQVIGKARVPIVKFETVDYGNLAFDVSFDVANGPQVCV